MEPLVRKTVKREHRIMRQSNKNFLSSSKGLVRAFAVVAAQYLSGKGNNLSNEQKTTLLPPLTLEVVEH